MEEEIVINNTKIQTILAKGIKVEEFLSLWLLSIGYDDVIFCDKVSLLSKGWLDSKFELTNKSRYLIVEIRGKQTLTDNYTGLHTRLQELLLSLTGKKQKVLQGKYSFLPNLTDFTRKLTKARQKYKLTDLNKIEAVLKAYIENCHKNKWEYCTLMQYYIMKEDSSKMATDYESYSEEKEVEVEVNDGVNI